VPASFILSQEIETESMLLMPRNSNSWDQYLVQTYSVRLSSILKKERTQFEDDPHDKLKPKLISQLETLNNFLNFPGKHPRRYLFPSCITRLREMISKSLSEELH